jgi:hypothetical protein
MVAWKRDMVAQYKELLPNIRRQQLPNADQFIANQIYHKTKPISSHYAFIVRMFLDVDGGRDIIQHAYGMRRNTLV